MNRIHKVAAACVFSGMLMSGCASEWERSYAPAGAAAGALPAKEEVKLREVPWQRLDAALVELENERAAADSPPDEWLADKKLAAKQKLLTALQVTADPARVEILGRSAFRTTSEINPDGGELASFARKMGADTVVWSRNYLGKTQVVRDEPVTEWRTGSWTGGHGKRRYQTYTESSTIWVPVVVEGDEHAFIAYYLRVQ